eukprot:1342932-Amorphochlora_amoeboformis.AAC.1
MENVSMHLYLSSQAALRAVKSALEVALVGANGLHFSRRIFTFYFVASPEEFCGLLTWLPKYGQGLLTGLKRGLNSGIRRKFAFDRL